MAKTDQLHMHVMKANNMLINSGHHMAWVSEMDPHYFMI